MIIGKTWVYNQVDENEVERLVNETGVSRLLAKVLAGRNINDKSYIRKFLNPSINDLYDPFLLKDMDKAVERIIHAINRKEKITLYGDYDVDGVTGTSILYDFLSGFGLDIDIYIPDRLEEGYGVSREAVETILKRGTTLMITIDCGITAVNEVAYAMENGMDVVITDHHECGEILPAACAVVNPMRYDCGYPFKGLAGVGVAFKLINALCIKMNMGNAHLKYLDLVSIGTVADIVSINDENRVIVKYGMDMIPETKNMGLRALLNKSGLEGKQIGIFEIAFIIGPRINAAGRIKEATSVVKMFTSGDMDECMDIAESLDEANKIRQEIENSIYKEAEEIIGRDIDLNKERVIVVAKEGWHHGVIGIVASKITEKYYRPCILISIDGDEGVGSGRSIEGFNIFEALDACREYLLKYGGHEMAAGLRINRDAIDDFKQAINHQAFNILTEDLLVPKIRIDAYVDNSDMNVESVEQCGLLSPFGPGNPAPVFAYSNLTINEVKNVGAVSKHLKLKLSNSGLQVDAIGFNMGPAIELLSEEDIIDVAARLELNSWNNTTKIQLNLKDIKIKKSKKEYYYSLDKCIEGELKYLRDCRNGNGYNYMTDESKIGALGHFNREDELIPYLSKALEQNRHVAVLVNSAGMLSELINIAEKLTKNIKISYNICYTSFKNGQIKLKTIDGAGLTIIVNPLPEEVDCSIFDAFVIAGGWLCRNCLSAILDKIAAAGRELVFYKKGANDPLETEEIVPVRDDLAALYRYIKLVCNETGRAVIDDLFVFTSRVIKEYNVSMSYVKVKKGLDIFNELGLLEVVPLGRYGAVVKYDRENVKRVNLEESLTFKGMQNFKKGF